MSDTLLAPAAARVRHLISPDDLDRPLIETLLTLAGTFAAAPQAQLLSPLKGRLLATLFYEPSTRTRLSFEAAMLRLGGQVISAENASSRSAASKGESLKDTIRVVAGFADTIVLRHPEVGAAAQAALASAVPIINAGDGAGHHPTQALLDLYTIRQELGRLDRLRIGLVGDLKHGRTVRSLALLLGQFPGNELVLVSPAELRMEDDVMTRLRHAGLRLREETDLRCAVGDLDVLYQTGIQRERFTVEAEYERLKDVYRVDRTLMQRLPQHAMLMHPLPRLSQIEPLVDQDPRSAYFRQAHNGLYVRMAVLHWLAVAN